MDRERPARIEDLLVHREFVRRMARGLVHGDADADDLAQEAWLAAAARPPREGPGLRGWFAGVLRRRRLMGLRSGGRRERREAAVPPPRPVPTPEEIVAREEVRRRVVEAVLALGEEHREVVLLRYWEELPPREMAARLGVPVETARSRLRRALERLRERLDGQERGRDGKAESWRALLPLLADPGTGRGAPAGDPSAAPGTGTGTGTGWLPPVATAALREGILMATRGKAAVVLSLLVLGGAAMWALRDGTAGRGGDGARPSRGGVIATTAGRGEDPAGTGSRPVAAVDADLEGSSTDPAEPARPAGSLHGVVLAAADLSPVPDAEVVAEPDPGRVPDGMTAESPPFRPRRTTTDGEGRFAFDPVPAGAWIVRAGHRLHGEGSTVARALSGGRWINVVLRPREDPPSLRVLVTDSSGAPVAGARVEAAAGFRAVATTGRSGTTEVTGIDGTCAFPMPKQSILLTATAPSGCGRVTWYRGNVGVEPDQGPPTATVVLAPAGRLSGLVTGAPGVDITGTVVQAWALSGESFLGGVRAVLREARVDEEGRYRIEDLPAGTWFAMVRGPRGLRVDAPVGSGSHAGILTVDYPRADVPAGGEATLDIPVATGGTLGGTVLRAEDGAPVAGAAVELLLPLGPSDYPDRVRLVGLPLWRMDAGAVDEEGRHPGNFVLLRTGADGSWSAEGLTPSPDWRVRVVGPPGLSFHLLQGVEVRAGERTTVEQRIAAAGTLEALLPRSAWTGLRRAGEEPFLAAFLATREGESNRIPGLPAGEWELCALSGWVDTEVKVIARFTVRAGETTFVDASRGALPEVAVRFLRGGLPVAGVRAFVLEDPAFFVSGADGVATVHTWVGASTGGAGSEGIFLRAVPPGRDDMWLRGRLEIGPAGADGVRRLDVILPDGRVTVRVTDDAGGPVPGVKVALSPSPTRGEPARLAAETRARPTDGRGTVGFSSVPGGGYRWEAQFPDGQRKSGTVEVDPGEVAEIAIRAEATGLVRVRVVDAEGRAVGGATVRILHLPGTTENDTGEPSWDRATVVPVGGRSDAAGLVRSRGATPGRVRVQATRSAHPWGFDDRAADLSDPVEGEVVAGGDIELTVRLKDTEDR